MTEPTPSGPQTGSTNADRGTWRRRNSLGFYRYGLASMAGGALLLASAIVLIGVFAFAHH